MNSGAEAGPGQQSFEATEEIARSRDLDSRNAFGRAISIDYWSIAPGYLAGLEADDLEKVEPSNLRSGLFVSAGPTAYKGVAFTATEYTMLIRYPDAFKKAVGARTLHARQLDDNWERKQTKRTDSISHAFEGKQKQIAGMIGGFDGMLKDLNKLHKEIKSPGYAHMNELKMRMLVDSVWQNIFLQMFDVVAEQKGWDGQTREDLGRALTLRLLTGAQRDKVSYWRQMVELGINYTHAKRAISRLDLIHIRRQLESE